MCPALARKWLLLLTHAHERCVFFIFSAPWRIRACAWRHLSNAHTSHKRIHTSCHAIYGRKSRFFIKCRTLIRNVSGDLRTTHYLRQVALEEAPVASSEASHGLGSDARATAAAVAGLRNPRLEEQARVGGTGGEHRAVTLASCFGHPASHREAMGGHLCRYGVYVA